ncbi:hypothetical protein D3C86_1346240 [compost metagenome]
MAIGFSVSTLKIAIDCSSFSRQWNVKDVATLVPNELYLVWSVSNTALANSTLLPELSSL